MNEEPKYIISGQVGYSGAGVVAGSDIEFCSECHTPVWCSPSSRQLKKEMPDILFLCGDCAKEHLKDAKPEDICPLNNGQIKELANTLGVSFEEAARRVYELQKKLPGLLLED